MAMRTIPALAGVFATIPLLAAAESKPAKPVDPNRRICRSETPTGSVMTRSMCRTNAEWQAIEGSRQRDVDHYREQSATRQVNDR